MDWQNVLVLIAIAVAGAYVLWCGRRALCGSKGGCSGGCGCTKTGEPQKTTALIAPEELVLRNGKPRK